MNKSNTIIKPVSYTHLQKPLSENTHGKDKHDFNTVTLATEMKICDKHKA